MTLLPADQAKVSAALLEVRKRAEAATQQPDTETTKSALGSVRDAVIKAAQELYFAELRARDAATRKLEQA